MTYLNAKKDGNMQWVEKVESRKVLWASPGPYLEKSTLLALGRNISGLELPPSLYEENTFDGEEAPQDELGMLAADLRTALITSNKDENEDEEEEEDDEEDDDCQNED